MFKCNSNYYCEACNAGGPGCLYPDETSCRLFCIKPKHAYKTTARGIIHLSKESNLTPPIPEKFLTMIANGQYSEQLSSFLSNSMRSFRTQIVIQKIITPNQNNLHDILVQAIKADVGSDAAIKVSDCILVNTDTQIMPGIYMQKALNLEDLTIDHNVDIHIVMLGSVGLGHSMSLVCNNIKKYIFVNEPNCSWELTAALSDVVGIVLRSSPGYYRLSTADCGPSSMQGGNRYDQGYCASWTCLFNQFLILNSNSFPSFCYVLSRIGDSNIVLLHIYWFYVYVLLIQKGTINKALKDNNGYERFIENIKYDLHQKFKKILEISDDYRTHPLMKEYLYDTISKAAIMKDVNNFPDAIFCVMLIKLLGNLIYQKDDIFDFSSLPNNKQTRENAFSMLREYSKIYKDVVLGNSLKYAMRKLDILPKYMLYDDQ
jgi:hypothetical protein